MSERSTINWRSRKITVTETLFLLSFYLCLGKKISGLEPETQSAVEIIYF